MARIEAVPIGLNGLGDTGFSTVRRSFERVGARSELVALNSRFSKPRKNKIPFQVASLIKFPSPDNPWIGHDVSYDESSVIIDGRRVGISQSDSIEKIRWLSDPQPKGVIDSTGVNKDYDALAKYFNTDSIRWVVLTRPPENVPGKPKIQGVVYGFNDKAVLDGLNMDEKQIISAASCTTMCLLPVVNELDRNLGIITGFASTTHAQTSSHTLISGDAKEEALMHPVDRSFAVYHSGADKMLHELAPELAAKFPFPVNTIRGSPKAGSILTLLVQVKEPVNVDRVNKIFNESAESNQKGIIGVINIGDLRDISNSSICVGDTHSALVLARHTQVHGDWVQVTAFYDNVGAYAARVIDLSEALSQRMC